MTPDAKRRVVSALMAEQFNRSVSQDTLAQPMAPGTEVAERSFFLPLGTYSDGRTGIAWPGIATEPAAAWSGLLNRAMNTGYVSGDTQNTEDAFNVAGAAMVGGLAAPKPSNTVGIFGGRLAKTADHAKLAQAERMAAEGAPREQIWNQTGWFQGPDKKWRFEIDDSKSVVYPGYLEQTGKSEHAAPFRDRMSHSGYTSAYPEASNINVQRMSGQQFPDRKGAGQYRDNHMWFDAAQPDRGRSIALHELQHDAQGREGFARGGSPKQFSADDIAAERQRSLSIGQPLADWSSISPAAGDWSDNIVRRNLYNRLSGEVEARAVQLRRDLTPEQRAARPPWLDYDVPESQQIVRFDNNGPSQSIGMSGRPEGAAVNAAGERQGGEGLLKRLMSMFRGASAEPLRGYRGDIYAERRNPNMYWAATDPAIASDYAMVGGSSRQPGYSPNVQPAEFRFKNPLEIDAQGSSWEKVPSPYGTTSTDEIATLAQNAQHDGVVFRNVHDPIGDVDGQVGTTIAALKRGTVYSPMTGELLFANGGRPGAAVGAVSTADIVKALMEDDANKYRGAI